MVHVRRASYLNVHSNVRMIESRSDSCTSKSSIFFLSSASLWLELAAVVGAVAEWGEDEAPFADEGVAAAEGARGEAGASELVSNFGEDGAGCDGDSLVSVGEDAAPLTEEAEPCREGSLREATEA